MIKKIFGKRFTDLPTIEDGGKSVDDTFRSIQFWSKEYKDSQDARDIIKNDIENRDLKSMYYFYSILTHDYRKGLLRRHLENINEVMGTCQSVSISYFDIFYGNVCLEITIKPNDDRFKQIGHDSEEFRIWEILALQKFIVNTKELEPFKDLEDFFDFRAFTKKLEKGGSWIHYANYLKEVTKIEYYYNIRKNEYEFRERQMENKLQKLNVLLIVSIVISIITFFLTPVYQSSVSDATHPTYNLYGEKILNYSSYPEPIIFAVAIGLTIIFYAITKEILERFDLVKLKPWFKRQLELKNIFNLLLWSVLIVGIIIYIYLVYFKS